MIYFNYILQLFTFQLNNDILQLYKISYFMANDFFLTRNHFEFLIILHFFFVISSISNLYPLESPSIFGIVFKYMILIRRIRGEEIRYIRIRRSKIYYSRSLPGIRPLTWSPKWPRKTYAQTKIAGVNIDVWAVKAKMGTALEEYKTWPISSHPSNLYTFRLT